MNIFFISELPFYFAINKNRKYEKLIFIWSGNTLLLFLFGVAILYSSAEITAQTNQYVNLSQSVLNSPSKPGWNLVFQDEFNGSKSSIWRNNPCWGNDYPDAPFYFRNSNYTQTSTSLKFVTTKDNPIIVPPSPDYVTKYYSSSQIESDPCTLDTLPQANYTYKYGYFEARIKNPKAQMMWPAFWLFGEKNSKSKWNEIDCFEFGTGDGLIMTNHYQSPSGTHQAKGKWVYSLPTQTFGNTWVTYALKWEPNKIVWYINNIPVRVETDKSPSTSIIPSTAMRVIAGQGLSEWYAPYDLHLPEIFPNEMEVDYVRVFQRSNYSNADPIFTISNGQTSYVPQSPVNVPFNTNLPIYIDGSQSYMPSHAYFLSVQRCDINGNLFDPEAMAWLSSFEVDNIQKFDIKAFASAHGLTMAQGNYYRIKLAGLPWVESNQYIYTTSCVNSVNFKINGQNTTAWPTAISIAYNNGKPRIISDVIGTITCDNSYFLSVAQCDVNGNVIGGTEKTKWLTESDKNYLGYFDIENFCNQSGLTLTDGNYYKVKWVAGNPWTEKAQVIYMTPCINSISFNINGQTNAFPSAINIANGSDILLDGSLSQFCTNNYFVSVQECNSNGSVFGVEITEWNSHFSYDSQNKIYYYSIGRYDIRDFCKRKNFDLGCNKYYRIKIATGSIVTGSWVELSKVIYIQPCSNINNSFEVYANYDANKHCYVANQCFSTDADNITLYAPNSIACNQSYFVSVQKILNGVLMGTEAMAWLSTHDIYDLKTLGVFNLKIFAKDPNHDGIFTDGFILCDPSDPNYPNISYRIKLVASSGSCNSYTWVENNKIIYFGGGSGRLAKIDSSPSQILVENLDGMQIYPNPTSNNFLITSSIDKEFLELKILNMLGKECKTIHNPRKQDIIDISEIPSGMYFVQVYFVDGTFVTKKLEIIK